MPQTNDSAATAPVAVLRLLTGTLRGGEFLLNPGSTLFITGAPDAFAGASGAPAEFPDNAIYIPAEDGYGNFEADVVIGEDDAPEIFLNDLSGSEDEAAAPYVLNTVRRICGLDIALRAHDDSWSDQVRGYREHGWRGKHDGQESMPPPMQQAQPQTASTAAATPAAAPKPKPAANLPRRIRRLTTALLLAALAIGAAWIKFGPKHGVGVDANTVLHEMKAAQTTQADRLSALLGGAGRYAVLPGRDGVTYVFAANDRDVSWARQALVRSAEAQRVRVMPIGAERARIERLLDGMSPAPAYHTVRLGNPARPELWLSRERALLDAAARTALARRLTVLLPYAESVGVLSAADAELAGQAEAGLERLGVPHRKIDNGGSITMSIRGALPDGELQKIRTYIEDFYRQWGKRYVHFSVEMEDDLRKGKSFEYGGEGYVKSGASHWDFSL